MRLENKVALIDGAASGIGKAAARLFALEGAQVVVVDINDDLGKETVNEIKDSGGEAYYIHADVGNVPEIRKMIDEVVERYHKLDVFWHNAGIPGPPGIEDVTEDAYDRVVNVHLRGAFFGAQYAIPQLRKSGGGCILFTSSVSGMKASSPSATYSCVKAAIVHLTRWLASKYAQENIRVNCISPGLIRTPMGKLVKREVAKDDSLYKELMRGLIAATPMKRLGEPEEVARAALFLASPEASYITGQILTVDGGLLVSANLHTGKPNTQ